MFFIDRHRYALLRGRFRADHLNSQPTNRQGKILTLVELAVCATVSPANPLPISLFPIHWLTDHIIREKGKVVLLDFLVGARAAKLRFLGLWSSKTNTERQTDSH